MADNVHRKSHNKHSDSKKLSTNPIIHRTTSETIRIGDPDSKYHQPSTYPSSTTTSSSNNVAVTVNQQRQQQQQQQAAAAAAAAGAAALANNQCRKKTSSFQITSVTVGCQMSNDAGEDSNDDLDESHTEDNSVEHSRITDIDIETPSYSEDTFSKEDVFFNTSNAALGTAPVIPTSSQYGLAIVPSEGNNVNNSVNDNNINTLDISSVTDNNIINLLSSNTKQDPDIREVHSHGRNERFKVVKIESTEPFKRGRWTCMDYLDHTSVNQPTAINSIKVSGPNEVCISYGITDSGIVVPDAMKQPQQLTLADVNSNKSGNKVDANGPIPHPDIIHSANSQVVAAGGTGGGGGNYPVNNPIVQQQQQSNVPLNVPPAQVQNQTQIQQPNSTQIPPQYFQPSQQQIPQQTQQQQGGGAGGQGGGGQGTTLPSNLQPSHPSNLGQPQSMPQGSIPIITQPNNNNAVANNQQNLTHAKDDNYVTVNAQANQQQTLPSQNVCQTNIQPSVVQSHPAAASSPANHTPNIMVTNVSHQQRQQSLTPQVSEPMSGMQSVQTIHTVPQSGAQQQQQQQAVPNIHGSITPVIPQAQMQPQSSGGSCQNVIGGIQLGTGVVPFHHSDTEQDPVSNIITSTVVAATTQSADATLLESLTEVTQSTDEHHALEDNESMSGTSAVAIDNKIEQAMDLVKSHLMFAVREEVEVLKEKIAELMDRINQLEAENLILKSHASPEILSQLSSSQSQTTAKQLPQTNTGNGQ